MFIEDFYSDEFSLLGYAVCTASDGSGTVCPVAMFIGILLQH
jgi:hypothetical protein